MRLLNSISTCLGRLSPCVLPVAAALLFGGCEFVSDTVVPAVDHTSPFAAPTIFTNGAHSWAEGKTFTTSSKNKTWIAVAGGFDKGGTKRLVMHREAYAYIDIGGGYGQKMHIHLAPKVITQSGSVGQTVDNGLWTVDFVKPSSFGAGAQGTVTEAGYSYWVEAEDFHGNTQIRPGASFIYRP